MPNAFTNPIALPLLLALRAVWGGTMVLGLAAALQGRPWRVVLPLIRVSGVSLGLVVHGTLGRGM